jgi:hypothetical protein
MSEQEKAGFADKLLAKIKSEKISPKPRWHFLLKDYVIWIAGALSLIVGALAVALIIYLLQTSGLSSYQETEKSFSEFILLNLPYFWLLFLGLFVFIVSYNFRHTGRGYRYSGLLLAGISIVSSIVLGIIFQSLGLGQKIDDVLGRRSPLYDRVMNPHVDFWSHPEEGRLAGLVVAVADNGYILVDRQREEWLLIVPAPAPVSLVGKPVRAIGRQSGDYVFMVGRLLPAGSGRSFYERFDGGPRPGRFDQRPRPLPPIGEEVDKLPFSR